MACISGIFSTGTDAASTATDAATTAVDTTNFGTDAIAASGDIPQVNLTDVGAGISNAAAPAATAAGGLLSGITPGQAILAGGALSAGANLASGVIGAGAAGAAASQSAAQRALTNANLAPFLGAGTGAVGQLQSLTGASPGGNPLTAPLTARFQPTMQQLEATPGYQFTLGQGEKAVTNAFTAQGLGAGHDASGNPVPSGPMGRGIADYAEKLASTTYQQQFGNYLTQNQQIYNMLAGLSTQGQSSAVSQGAQGIQSTNQINQANIAGANAITGAIGGVAGAGTNTALLLALNNAGMFGAPATTPPTSAPAGAGAGGGGNALSVG